MNTKLAVLIAAFLGSASPVLAQSEAGAFNGPYAGVGVGGLNDSVSAGGIFDKQDQTSAAFTGFVGYDYTLPHNFVIGAEAGAVYAADDEQSIGGSAGAINLNPKYEINATGRIGYLVRPDVLVYGRGGYANLEADVEQADAPGVTLNQNYDGWVAGGGVEYSFYKNLSARIEYRYQNLNDGDVDIERDQAFVGLSYRF